MPVHALWSRRRDDHIYVTDSAVPDHRHTAPGRPVAGARSLPGASCDLRQRRLRLGELEVHVHRTVQRDGSGQLLTGLLPPADLRIEDTEAAMGMGLEWAHL